MSHSEIVTVYNFQLVDDGIEAARMATFKASREQIGTIPSARVLEGTGEDVPLSELDAQGRYRRIATGWGEL
jgi:hypothetical protein